MASLEDELVEQPAKEEEADRVDEVVRELRQEDFLGRDILVEFVRSLAQSEQTGHQHDADRLGHREHRQVEHGDHEPLPHHTQDQAIESNGDEVDDRGKDETKHDAKLQRTYRESLTARAT